MGFTQTRLSCACEHLNGFHACVSFSATVALCTAVRLRHNSYSSLNITSSMSGGVQPPANPDPLRETSRYTKVADLSHGSFGFVQLARNTETQELVAIKFIERGDRVNRCVRAAQHPPAACANLNPCTC
jgi:hypothetical protein